MALDKLLLDILACPEDRGPLYYFEDEDALYNPRLHRRYAIRDGIPIMLIDEAETVDEPSAGAQLLPGDLSSATDLFEASELARDTLGDRLCDWYVLNKRREWAEYRTTVSPFERGRYLRL